MKCVLSLRCRASAIQLTFKAVIKDSFTFLPLHVVLFLIGVSAAFHDLWLSQLVCWRQGNTPCQLMRKIDNQLSAVRQMAVGQKYIPISNRTLVNGNLDYNLWSISWWFNFDPHPSNRCCLWAVSATQLGSVFFLESRIYTKRELHHVRVGNLAGERRRAEASRRHFAHILVFLLRRRARRHLMELLCIV